MSPDFKVQTKDRDTMARCGELKLKHGVVQTPSFMPVGTNGAIRGLPAFELQEIFPDIMLANTYHMMNKPGIEVIEKCGGLHKFMSWDKPILTDSGGFQVFSLTNDRKITDKSVVFRIPESGDLMELSPEIVVDIQQRWGSDVMMVLDECPPANADLDYLKRAVDRTTLWAERSRDAHTNKELALFPIVQGACDISLRQKSLNDILEIEKGKDPWPGIAIGGLSVGESKADFVETLFNIRKMLPTDRPHYLMGVGTPRDLVFSVACGIDMFDCVMPSRNGRHGVVMTSEGKINLLNAKFLDDSRPIDPKCACRTCQHYSRAFVRHMLNVKDALGAQLATIHNVHFFVHFMKMIREKIEAGEFFDFAREFLTNETHVYLGGEAQFKSFPESYV